MKIQQLRTNHMDCPLGNQIEPLFLSWEVVETESAGDEWTEIEISLDSEFQEIVFTSGQMKNWGKPYYSPKFTPEAETRYYWRVRLATIEDGTAVSSPVRFETALPLNGWQAEWIGTDETQAMPELYQDFYVKNEVKRARIYCYGVGLYEGYLNQEKIGDEYLMPGYHSYDFINQYQTYDVTQQIRQGDNRLSFILGEGWYKGRFVFEGGYENLYGNRKKLIAMLKIEYADGSSQLVATDEKWQAHETSILANNIYDGEQIHTEKVKNRLNVVCIPDSKELLKPRYSVPLRKVEEYPVKEILHTPSGQVVLDFGEMITGWVEVEACGRMDFCLQYAEHMQEGEIYRDNLRTAKAEFTFCGQSDEKWIRPHFTYFGFRYVQVTGMEKVTKQQFKAYRLMSDMEQTGSLVTSNPQLNQLVENSLRSQKCNFIDIPLDCPQRDERLGWTGDIAVFANTGSYQMYTPAFLNHYMKNLQLEQKEMQGAVPFFVPKPKPAWHEGINPFLITAGVCTWGDAATIVPWTLFTHYENIEMLREHYAVMTSWIGYLNGRVAENEKPFLWQNDRQLGDWLALDNGNPQNPIGKTDPGFIASAYYYYSTMLCRKAAKILGLGNDMQKWEKQRSNIRRSFIHEYLDQKGELLIEGTQTAYAMLLYLGLYEQEKKQILVEGLKRELEKYHGHLCTGFVGTGMLLEALSANGLEQEAYSLLLQEDYPSWLGEVKLGATTIWERWNSLNADGTISGEDMNSLNHYAYGCVTGWMYETLCGFKWQSPGIFQIKPVVDKRLSFVEGSYQTCYGPYRIRWEWKEENKIAVTIVIPFQAKAEIVLPWGEVKTVESGTYTFES